LVLLLLSTPLLQRLAKHVFDASKKMTATGLVTLVALAFVAFKVLGRVPLRFCEF